MLPPALNDRCADRPEFFVNGTILQSTLRELRALLASSRVWAVFLIVVALFAVTGPFGTSESLAFHARLGYWLVVHALARCLALTFVTFFDAALARIVAHALPRMLVGAGLAALPMALAIMAVNASALRQPFTLAEYGGDILNALPVSLALCLLVWLALGPGHDIGEQARPRPPDTRNPLARPFSTAWCPTGAPRSCGWRCRTTTC